MKLSATAIGSQHQSDISIFPNPIKGSFTIGGLAGTFNLQVFNATGLKIKDTEIELPGHVDLSNYANGIYVIRIENGVRSWLEKVVKEEFLIFQITTIRQISNFVSTGFAPTSNIYQ